MQNRSKLDVTQAAQDWADRGVFTVPLREGTKIPIGKEWQKLRLVDEDFGKRFKPGNNLGGLWGKPSRWAVDLDLDLETAPEVAQHIIPHYLDEDWTFCYGRREKRESHYIFRCVNAETKKWQVQGPEEIGMVVEIRSTGAQSVLPPSKHPEGDRYFIEEDLEFYDISRLDLERMAGEIAIASMMLWYYPDKHGRHDYVHACTGSLCHAGWSDEKILLVMGAVLSCVEDEELGSDRIGAVRNTMEHFDNNDKVKGFPALEEFMTTKAIQELRRWAQGGAEEARITVAPKKALKPGDRSELKFNPDWLNVDGLLGDVIMWSHKQHYLQQPIFDLAAAIMCTAMVTQNKYLVEHWDTPLQPYVMCVAPTGGGKEGPLQTVATFASKLGIFDDYVSSGFQSYYALLDKLEDVGGQLLIWDEVARNLAAAKNPGNMQHQIITHMISLYGKGNSVVAGQPGRTNEIGHLHHPFFLVLATAQPEKLMEALTSDAKDTGFANRFQLFDAGESVPPVNQRRHKVWPTALRDKARHILTHETEGEFTEIGFAEDHVFFMFQKFEEMARHRAMQSEESWARANQNALILAGLAAVGVDPDHPQITEEQAQWAIDVTTWSNENWVERIRLTGGGSAYENHYRAVQRVITYPARYKKQARGINQHKLLDEGYMPQSVLVRCTGRIKKPERQSIIDDLCDAEIVKAVERHDNICYYALENLRE